LRHLTDATADKIAKIPWSQSRKRAYGIGVLQIEKAQSPCKRALRRRFFVVMLCSHKYQPPLLLGELVARIGGFGGENRVKIGVSGVNYRRW